MVCRMIGKEGGETTGTTISEWLDDVYAASTTPNQKAIIKQFQQYVNGAADKLKYDIFFDLDKTPSSDQIQRLKKYEKDMDFFGQRINRVFNQTMWKTSANKCGFEENKTVCGEPVPIDIESLKVPFTDTDCKIDYEILTDEEDTS